MERITGKSAFDMDVLNRYMVSDRLYASIFCFPLHFFTYLTPLSWSYLFSGMDRIWIKMA